jgi:hypothetical protein
VRHVVAKWVEKRRRTGAHRRRRIRSGELADARNSDERFLDLDDVSGREGKRGEGGMLGVTYSRLWLGGKARVRARGEIEWLGHVGLVLVSGARKGVTLNSGARSSAGGGRQGRTDSGQRACWAMGSFSDWAK